MGEKTDFSDNDNPEDAIFIHNPGLVILAPYLQRYFDMLEMIEEKQFKEEAMQIRAVHLLEYLVSGQTSTPEQLLVFNKIICGLPIDTSIPLEIEVTQQEEETSTQLLNSVLHHWKSMQNSSVENLRGSFLLREGMLNKNEEHWRLAVETKPYDILLDTLPWTISFISLPWIKKGIQVKWR